MGARTGTTATQPPPLPRSSYPQHPRPHARRARPGRRSATRTRPFAEPAPPAGSGPVPDPGSGPEGEPRGRRTLSRRQRRVRNRRRRFWTIVMPAVAGATAGLALTGALLRDGAPRAFESLTLVVHVHADGRADRIVLAGVDASGRAALLAGPARLPDAPADPATGGPVGPALARRLERELAVSFDRVVVVDDDLLGRILDPSGEVGSAPRTDRASLESWVDRLGDPGTAAAVRRVDGRLDGFVAAAASGEVAVGVLPEARAVPVGAAGAEGGGPPVLDVDRARVAVARLLPSLVEGSGAAGG